MQTFLPYEDFAKSALVLDRLRLGKQRVETLQIAKVVSGQSSGWEHHPAVLMWKGYPEALMSYQTAVCDEWTQRGYVDSCLDKTAYILGVPPVRQENLNPELLPPWLGDEEFHISHRSNLVRKDTEYYGSEFSDVPPNLPYIWPVQIVR
jgi:hypothetical protein